MTIDPRDMDSDDLKSALEGALGNLSPDDVDAMAMSEPQAAETDEQGRVQGRILAIGRY